MTPIVGVALALPGAAVAVCALYLLTLALASSVGRRVPAGNAEPRSLLAVLVPAHDEERLIARCVESLLTQTYPRALYRVIVIADNCSDSTAEIARVVGAQVMVRDQPDARGKGQALRWAMDRVLAAANPPDAVVVVDADSIADSNLLSGLERQLAAGHGVVQCDYTVIVDPASPR